MHLYIYIDEETKLPHPTINLRRKKCIKFKSTKRNFGPLDFNHRFNTKKKKTSSKRPKHADHPSPK